MNIECDNIIVLKIFFLLLVFLFGEPNAAQFLKSIDCFPVKDYSLQIEKSAEHGFPLFHSRVADGRKMKFLVCLGCGGADIK